MSPSPQRRKQVLVATVPLLVTLLAGYTLGAWAESPRQPAIAGAVAAEVAAGGMDPDPRLIQRAVDLERAVASYQALRAHFTLPGGFLSELVGSRLPSTLWPFSQALAAETAMARLPGIGPQYRPDVKRAVQTLERYFDDRTAPPAYRSKVVRPAGQLGDQYYDDNEWIGVALVDAYRVTGDTLALTRAEQAFQMAVSGWDRTGGDACPGGVFWKKVPTVRERNAVSNAPGAVLGLLISGIVGGGYYRDWAVRMYRWVLRCLMGPNGLVQDHLSPEGRIDPTEWSYNQGAMIEAAVLLYRQTGDSRALAQAGQMAAAGVQRFAGAREPPWFLSIFFSSLADLQATTNGEAFLPVIRSFADQGWTGARNPVTGLFTFGFPSRFALLQQAAMVQIYSLLAS